MCLFYSFPHMANKVCQNNCNYVLIFLGWSPGSWLCCWSQAEMCTPVNHRAARPFSLFLFHRDGPWPWHSALSFWGARCLQNGTLSSTWARWHKPDRKLSTSTQGHPPTHLINQSLWLNLKGILALGGFQDGGGGELRTAWLLARCVIWTEIPLAPSGCRPWWSCPHFSSRVSILLSFTCADLPVTRMQPRHF